MYSDKQEFPARKSNKEISREKISGRKKNWHDMKEKLIHKYI